MRLHAFSKRVENLELSETYAILDMVRSLREQGEDIVDLGGGEPDFRTPNHVVDAAVEALSDGDTHYTPSRGTKALLDAVAHKYKTEHGLDLAADKNIIVTPSAKHALFITLMTLLDQGDEIIIPTPSWVSYKAMAAMAGATVKAVPLDGKNGFMLEADALEQAITPRTKAILINNPNNPTGRVLTREEVTGVVQVALKHGLYIISDEIYEKVIYGQARHISIASIEGAQDTPTKPTCSKRREKMRSLSSRCRTNRKHGSTRSAKRCSKRSATNCSAAATRWWPFTPGSRRKRSTH